jgi:UDP-2,4-diacetamido-2,4,6-trideoxy-beta-L-altropyranose hydrolase
MPAQGTPLLLRFDASDQLGFGHAMRCLALAQAWEDNGGRAISAVTSITPSLESTFEAGGIEVVHLTAQPGSLDDAREIAALKDQVGASWVVADGYNFDSSFQQALKKGGACLLLVDDMAHYEHYYADVILNQNLHANERNYVDREGYTRLLLGTRYALIRKEFLRWRKVERSFPKVAKKVLVSLGGGVEKDATLKTMNALRGLPNLDVLVLGGREADDHPLRRASTEPRSALGVQHDFSGMSEVMAWADMAVTGGGSTCWEAAFMGLPSLLLVLAENQVAVATSLSSTGVAYNLGWHHEVSQSAIGNAVLQISGDVTERRRMSERARELVDGDGASRVAAIMGETAN